MTAKCMFWLAVMFSGAAFTVTPVLASQKDSPVITRLKSLSLSRKIFCFLNSGMLCELCSMYTRFIIAPYESTGQVFTDSTILPALGFLGMSVIVGAVFFRTLTVKLPVLMNEDRIAGVWRYMFLFPLVMSIVIHWMTPISPRVVMTGRVRPVSLVLVTFVMASAFMFYHISWWTTVRLTESARLQQENTFLQMEAKRYNEMQSYMNYSREMRHNFRQHILVITSLVDSGQLPELREYLSQFAGLNTKSYTFFCPNHAVDAGASHSDRVAGTQDTAINWRLELPAELAVREADYCAIFGNLIENALTAVKSLPPESRRINVISSMLSQYMTGISINNPFSGKITFGKNGLPVSPKAGHGIGLASVMNTVERYGGSMNITAEGNVFSVDIILYSEAVS